jgi:hypothetical protein
MDDTNLSSCLTCCRDNECKDTVTICLPMLLCVMSSSSGTANDVSAKEHDDTDVIIVAGLRIFPTSKVPWKQQKHRLLDLFNNQGRSVKDINRMMREEGQYARYVLLPFHDISNLMIEQVEFSLTVFRQRENDKASVGSMES